MFLNYLRTTVRENYLVSALNTNLITGISSNSNNMVRVAAFPVHYKSASKNIVYCNQNNPISAATLNPLFNGSVILERIREFESMPNSTIVSGFFAACTPLEALLQSTLDCLYEIECSIIVLLLFNSLSTQAATVTIPNPSLDMYKNLQTLHSTTLNCPCSTKTISYRSFVSLSPVSHQVCSSGFVTDDWVALLKRSTITEQPDDWRNRAGAQFQLLSDFCQLANKTIDDSVDRFLKKFFIASTVFNEIDFNTQLNSSERRCTSFVASRSALYGIATDGKLKLVSFILPEIPEINSTMLTCVCATNPHCRALNVIYTQTSIQGIYVSYVMPSSIRGCLNSDSLLLSTLQCLYADSDCFPILLSHLKKFYSSSELKLSLHDISPLINDPTQSRFPPNTLVSTIFKEMMVEQWNESSSYKNFYESCAPIHCTYSEKIRTKTIAGIMLALMSVIGGLVVSLRLITPTTVRENYLVSALNTNLITGISSNSKYTLRVAAFPVYYKSASGDIVLCNQGNPTSAATLNPLLNGSVILERIREFESMPNSTIVSGFFAACTPLKALLQSTLDCLYEIECLQLLSDYFPPLNHMGVNWTDVLLTSKQQNLSVNDYFNNLFIEDWLPQINYSKYFDECHPSVCTYTTTDRADISYTIALFISLYGGLVIILRLSTSFLVNVSLKFKHRPRNTSVHFGNLFRYTKKNFRRKYNLYSIFSVSQRSIIILLLFNSLSTQTVTVTIINPSLNTYKNLQMLYSATLNCPCSTKTISYRSFVSLSPVLHQVCSSGFITDDWVALLKRSTAKEPPNDWRNRAVSQFQLLSDFCELADKTINDSVDRFLKKFFIASTVFNEIDFNTQLNVSFILPEIPESNSTMLTCVCATNPHCQGSNVIYTPELVGGMYHLYVIPSSIRGCLNSDSLLLSTLQCLYADSDCFPILLSYLSKDYGTDDLKISLHNISPLINDPTRSRFPPNTLVSTIFKEMMVEQWNASWPYKNFYESCAPIHCTYSEKIRTKTIAGIILALMSVIGGLVVSLRLITPYLVRFFYYLWEKINKRQQNQQQDEQGKY
ncbi:unnamed protein product [Adineta steineri]|uniref:Uncharacterized protein n=1 Tax=Adineta steineri TaxID=433720 RepID=A0A813TPA2_9BILA|nr:unnamed protein product [Adineta steineri]